MTELNADVLNRYAILWNNLQIKPEWKSQIFRTAKAIQVNKDKYQTISTYCGGSIPWEFIGIVHNLECGLNFRQHLHNGDSLERRTVQVPSGRPSAGSPPFTFNESAVDALRIKKLHQIPKDEWSCSRMGYEFEKYNGWGYANKKLPSPYLWSGSTAYTKGKFVKDHVYDPNEVSQQSGAMCLLYAIQQLEKEAEAKKPTRDYDKASKKSRRLTIINYVTNFLRGLTLPISLSVSFLQEVKDFASDHAGLAIIIFLGLGWLTMEALKYISREEVEEGRYKTKED